MSNNPIKSTNREIGGAANSFTATLQQDAMADAIEQAGIKPDLEPEPEPVITKPVDLPDDPAAIANTAKEVVGRKLTREEQIQFLNELPPDLLGEFANRVKLHMQEEVTKEKDKTKSSRYVTDFSTIQENDVFNLDIPIQAIDHQTPEYMNVELKDSNFVPRWIQTSAIRIGQAKSQGWQYVVADDLAQKLNIEIEESVDGHFIYSDVVLMKCTKAKVFSQLRANFQRALAITHPSRLHERMRSVIENEIEKASDPRTGEPLYDAFHKYKDSGGISTYAPLSGK